MQLSNLPLKAFIDPDFRGWLPTGLPARLQNDLTEEFGEEFGHIFEQPVFELFELGLTASRFNTRLSDLMAHAHEPRNKYHNQFHCHWVSECADCLLRLVQQLVGKLPEGLVQGALMGYAGHDLDHPGATFYINADPKRIPPGTDPHTTTVEFHSACRVDELMWQWGFSVMSRLVAVAIIIASAYGGGTDHGKKLGVHRVKPQGILTTGMRAMDVTPQRDLTTSVHNETAVLYEEVPALPAPISWRGYLQGRRAFLGYIGDCLNDLDAAVWMWLTLPQKLRLLATNRGSKHPTRTLGWRENLQFQLCSLGLVEQGKHSIYAALIRSRLYVLNVPLD